MSAVYHIRVPLPTGGEKYIAVNPDKLTLNTVAQTYIQDPVTLKFQEVKSAPHRRIVTLNVSQLTEEWLLTVEKLTQALTGEESQDDHKSLLQLVQALSKLPDLMQSIARGNQQESSAVLHAIAATTGEALPAIKEKYRQLTQSSRRVEALETILAAHSGRNEERALGYALKLEEGTKILRWLTTYKADLENLLRMLEPAFTEWSYFTNGDSSWLDSHLRRLGSEPNGFCDVASNFLLDPTSISPGSVDSLVKSANGVIDMIQDKLQEMTVKRSQFGANIASLHEQSFELNRYTRELGKIRETLVSLDDGEVAEEAIKQGLVTQEQYDTWIAYTLDAEWSSPQVIERFIGGKLSFIQRMHEQEPALPKNAQQVIEQAKYYLNRLEDPVSDVSPSKQIVPPKAKPPVAKKPQAASTVVNNDPVLAHPAQSRFEQLYECMLAIGSVVYCGSAHFVGGTSQSLLSLMEKLNVMTPSEKTEFGKVLTDYLLNDSQVLDISAKVVVAWRTTNPADSHWIKFAPNAKKTLRLYRLVEQAQSSGEALCQKHGLTPEHIRQAFQERREEQQARAKSRREG